MLEQVYLDYAATTPLDPQVLQAMLPYLKGKFGNPASLHKLGQEAANAVEQAREKIAQHLGTEPAEVIFTSGATESDNLAIKGLVRAVKIKQPHIITSSIEHPAVLEPCQNLAKQGCQVTYLPVDKKGLVKVADFKKAIKENTVLVSIMYVNNEVGTIQPIAECGELLREINKTRGQKIYFHTDAAQAFNYCELCVDKLGVDLLSLSGHKIYGPKGVGALYLKKNTPCQPLQEGGHQERGLRSGTLNVAGIVGLGKAVELVSRDKSALRVKKLQDKLIKGILKKIPASQVNGDLNQRVPNNVHFSFKNAEGESMLIMLAEAGIAVSTGSACSSGSLASSHVLQAMGLAEEFSHGSLRLTLGRQTTSAQIKRVLEILPQVVKKLRQIAPKN